MNKSSDAIFVLGPGPSLLNPEVKQIVEKMFLKNIPILAFQKTFPYCESYFNITPDFWTFFDPASSLPGLRSLSKNNKDRKTKVILTTISKTQTPAGFRKYCATGGTTPLEYDPPRWDEYLDLLSKLPSDRVIHKNADTIFRIQRDHPDKFLKINGNLTSQLRNDKVIFGTQLDPRLPNPGAENKFSMVVLPLIRSLGFRRVYTAGFDGLPGRFYQIEEPNDCKTKNFVSKYHYLKKWKESEEQLKMKISSVNSNCLISKIIGVTSVEDII